MRDLCVLPAVGQVVQTGSDVMSVVVDLFTVEAALHLQAAERLTELEKLRPPALAMKTLVTHILQRGGTSTDVSTITLWTTGRK